MLFCLTSLCCVFFFLKIFLGGCLSLVQRICVFKYIDAVMNSVSIDNCPTETTALPGREHPHVARKCHLVNESCDSEMQRAVCPLVTLFHQEHQLTRACWWKTWHWAIITTAACGAAFGREKRLHLLLKCFTFCWDRVTLSATCLLRKLQSKAKLMSYNMQGEQQAFWVMSAPKQQGHANSERKNRDGVKAWQTRHVPDSERCDSLSFYTVWSDRHNEALHPP